MPLLLRIGFAIVAAGLAIDVVHHGAGAGGPWAELSGHVLSLIGMLVVLAGLLTTAVRAHRPTDRSTP
ncbi:MAG TPA: hypothetical protein VNQ77_05580 [Frankiaceae bacterium]|nr:hypothetical protein [Frankiaceae bacterium]